MQLDLHRAVRETYRQALAGGRSSREAFDVASGLLSANAPELTQLKARRLAAEMLCWDPGPSIASSPGSRLDAASTGNFPASDRSSRALVTGTGAAETDPDRSRPQRLPRPSDMRLLSVWHPAMPISYRVDFFNTFARCRGIHKALQRSMVVHVACVETALEIAKARFAELEGVRDWHTRAAQIEAVPLQYDPGPRCGRKTKRASPKPAKTGA
jgi:hypothetical protein